MAEQLKTDTTKCLCIVGCSVDGECPIHGDRAHPHATNEERIDKLEKAMIQLQQHVIRINKRILTDA